MPRSCSVGGCTSGYDSNKSFKGRVYGFPADISEKEAWVNALPNYIDPAQITVYMGVCDLHWPPGVPTKKRHRWLVPAVPPSVFSVDPLFCRQTIPKKQRNIEERRISQGARAQSSLVEIEAEKDPDVIDSWNEFIQYCEILDYPLLKNDSGVTLLGMAGNSIDSPPELHYSVRISLDFKVRCFKHSSIIPVRHLLNRFTSKLERYSHLINVLDYVSNANPLLETELRYVATYLETLSQNEEADDDMKHRLSFLSSQILLSSYKRQGRRYSPRDIKIAIDLFLRSRNCYSALRETLLLPHPNTLKSLFGKIDPGSANECKSVIKSVFSELRGKQRYCKILADEVHIKPAIRYQGNHVIGFATDEPTKAAKTILALMVCPILGGPAFVARLVPVFSLKHELLYEQVLLLIEIIHELAGYVFLVMSDNLKANISCFNKFRENFGQTTDFSVNHPVKNECFLDLFLLFDPIHLFKNIKNNWLTEKMKKLSFEDFETGENFIADWKHIIQIYEEEKELITKRTLLNFSTIYPTNFDKQKVQLTMNVFNEKMVAVLKEKTDYRGTEIFVRLVTRMINILNIKSPYAGKNLNDPDREIFDSVSDDRLLFLESLAKMFEKMDRASSNYSGRVMTLTSQTSNALSITIRGIIELIKVLLGIGVDYILTGCFQSDRLEGEFGIYRQLNGGNFYMSAEHVQNALKLQRIKLFSSLKSDLIIEHSENQCCQEPLNPTEIEELDKCFHRASDMSEIEMSSLYYISGYVCQKENIKTESAPSFDLPASEFTKNVSRGKLRHPPMDLYNLSLYLYSYYKSVDDKSCLKKLMIAFKIIYESSHSDFGDSLSILRRYLNTFTKGFVKRDTDRINIDKKKKEASVKRRRIAGD